jgi:methylated-DNA-[protein]-cysteine S-methyltransferase
MLYFHKYTSPVGLLTITSDWKNLTWLYFDLQKYFPDLNNHKNVKTRHCLVSTEAESFEIFQKTKIWLDNYFAGKNPKIELPLEPKWTEFQKSVWKILLEIPYWKTTTYWEIAKKLWIKSARAVGGAVGHNPISIIIPCHRVIWKNGKLTWYAGGIDKKMELLELEWGE